MLIGAAVLYGLEQGLGVQIYIAIPMAIVAYLAVKLALGLMWGAGGRAYRFLIAHDLVRKPVPDFSGSCAYQ